MTVGSRIRRALAEAMRLLHMRGLVNLRGGNASARLALPDGTTFIYITPSGVAKPLLQPSDIAVMGIDGTIIEGKPSSEYRLHLAIYRDREDVNAVVHAHCPLTVAASDLGALDNILSAGVEARYYIGDCVGFVPLLEPGTEQLAKEAAKALSRCNVAVLEKHGAVAVGLSSDPVEAIYEALDRLEALEDAAKIVLARMSLGELTR